MSQGGLALVPLDMTQIKPKRQSLHSRHGLFSQLQELKGKACCLLVVPVTESKEGRLRGFPRRCLDK